MIAHETPSIHMVRRDIAAEAHALISRLGSFREVHLLCDTNTYNVLGQLLELQLSEQYDIRLHKLSSDVKGDVSVAKDLMNAAEGCECLITVGSGTLNDIGKHISHEHDLPFVIFPTAPSMNGYVSDTSSLMKDGIKSSLKTKAPDMVLCDLSVIANAPMRMIQAGLGDSICRSASQFDWLLSHLLLDTPYSTKPYTLLEGHESKLFNHSAKLAERDLDIMEALMRTLLASGEGMRMIGGSYPASQGEHMIAHTMEMLYGDKVKFTFHGEQIGVTTLTAVRLQEQLLAAKEPPQICLRQTAREKLDSFFGESLGQALYMNYQRKGMNDPYVSAEVNMRMRKQWKQIRVELEKVMIPVSKIEEILRQAGAPTTVQELGWSDTQYHAAVALAPFTRDRFTVLDVLGTLVFPLEQAGTAGVA